MSITPDQLIKVLGFSYLKSQKILPLHFDENSKRMLIGAVEENYEALAHIQWICGCPIDYQFIDIRSLESKLFAAFEEKIKPEILSDEISTDGIDLYEQDTLGPASLFLGDILRKAIQKKASDIHFDPFEKGSLIRLRIDGVMVHHAHVTTEIYQALVSRLKILANLDISQKRLPQDGRLKFNLADQEIDVRLSTLPLTHGERVVLRILQGGNSTLGLQDLGIPNYFLKSILEAFQKPEGLILVTGPTGSGKTTTLYSAINFLKKNQGNIMTIEDPVECKIDGIAQMNVSPKIGLTFAAGLRHILRQDPDVILVGEIRDHETALIAIQSSLTGHLVFSTLHSNDAPSAIPRLINMGIEPYLIASSLNGILSQRLVRKLCSFCKRKGFIGYEPVGCEQCSHTGYMGRIGVFEWMPVGVELKECILKDHSAHNLKEKALKLGMISLESQLQELIEMGVTSFDQVIRVSGNFIEGA